MEALKGVGPQVAKLLKKLDIDPRRRPALSPADRLDRADPGAGRDRRAARTQRDPRADPFRYARKPIRAAGRSGSSPRDSDGNTISLVYFNNPGWAKRQLPKGEKRIVSGKLELMATSGRSSTRRSREPGKGPPPLLREPVYPLTEGLTNRRLGELASEALERAPDLAEWIEPPPAPRMLGRLARVAGAGPIANRAADARAGASPMTRFSPTSSPCCCFASRSGGIAPRRCPARAS